MKAAPKRQAPQRPAEAASRAPWSPAARVAPLAGPQAGGGRCACGGGCPRCQGSRPAARPALIPPAPAPAALRPPTRATPPLQLGHVNAAEEAAAEQAATRVTGRTARPARSGGDDPALLARVDVRAPLKGGGQPLDPAQRRVFQAQLRRDLSDIRLHRGSAADAATAGLQASAYALGPHIVMGARAPALHTPAGAHLLAHELAHTGQAGAAHTVRRTPADYEIRHTPVNAASDTGTIYFERGSDTVSAAEQAKIAAMATPPAQNLTLHGFASEDADAATRTARVNARLAAVAAALVAAGHTGTRALVPHPDSGVGNLDYRSMRSVQVMRTPVGLAAAPTPVNPCQLAGSDVASGAELTACESAFTTAFPEAKKVVDKAEKDIVTSPTPAANALVSRFFGGVPRGVVNTNVTAVAAQVRRLPTAHSCHTACDGGCDRPAFNSGHGLAARPAGALMTLCPDFVTASLPFRIQTLIHESAHGTASGTIVDIAYSSTRLVPFLLAADSRRNTDSYVLLMRLVHDPTSMVVGPAAQDTLTGMTAAGPGSDTEKAQRSVAWLESWLNYGGFDTSILYATVHASLQAGHWVTTTTNEFNIETQHRLAQAFPGDFTDPGADGSARTSPPAPLPTQTDKERVAAVRDRFVDLYSAVNQRPITVSRGPAGSSDTWGAQPSRPYLLPTVTMSPGFFALSSIDQVRRLVGTMVRAHRDISPGFEPKYVVAIDLIHTHRRLGP